jgi:hypothetical protein
MSDWLKGLGKLAKEAGKSVSDAADHLGKEAGKVLKEIEKKTIEAKDSVVSFGLKEYLLERYVKKYGGKMLSFKLDTNEKQVEMSVELKGESSPIDITIRYETEGSGDGMVLRATSIVASREWLNLVAAELLRSGKIPPFQVSGIPGVAAKIIGL